MTQTLEITVADLIKVKPMAQEDAQKILDDTKKAMIDGNPAQVKPQTPTSITLELQSDLGNDPLIILLSTNENEIIAVLSKRKS